MLSKSKLKNLKFTRLSQKLCDNLQSQLFWWDLISTHKKVKQILLEYLDLLNFTQNILFTKMANIRWLKKSQVFFILKPVSGCACVFHLICLSFGPARSSYIALCYAGPQQLLQITTTWSMQLRAAQSNSCKSHNKQTNTTNWQTTQSILLENMTMYMDRKALCKCTQASMLRHTLPTLWAHSAHTKKHSERTQRTLKGTTQRDH